MTIQQLANHVLEKHCAHTEKERPFIVAIDGLSGAGKTTLVEKLEQHIKEQGGNVDVCIVHIDDHIVEKSKRYNTGHDEWYEYYVLQWDVDMLKTVLFEKLHKKVSEKLTVPFYDKMTDTMSTMRMTVQPNSIVLIEGIFLQRKEWRPFFDLTIFIDCPRELRYERVLNRDQYIGDEKARLDKYKRRYWPGEDHYLNTVNPLSQADFIYHAR